MNKQKAYLETTLFNYYLDEVHATRRKLNEATKDMTSSERTAYYNQTGEAVAKKYGFNRVASAREASNAQSHK